MPVFEFLGPYRLGKPLGRGGMGTVYSAVHQKTGDKVAVKLIAAHVADEPRFRRRFEKEVKTLQQLRHANIVRLIGYGEEQGQLFYSMELVDGESLQARIRREKKISWLPALEIAIQVSSALKHAHDIGVFHRDLKPANLMIAGDQSVKLVDFGISKIFGDTDQTLAGSVLGTADYMAPEQATSEGITVRTDLYALGSVMYAMLAGRPPFRGKNITEVIEALKRDQPAPLELIDPHLPEEIVQLVHQLLEKNPQDRPPTALSVMNRLKAMRAGLQKEITAVQGPATKVNQVAAADEASTHLHGSGIDPSKIRVSPTHRTVVSRAAGASSPDAPTVATGDRDAATAHPDHAVAAAHGPMEAPSRTHFQTVSETDPVPGFFQRSSDPSRAHWMSYLGIAAMIGALVMGAGFLVYAMRPPTADQLYKASVQDNDTSAMKSFLRRYPDDPRHDEVRSLQMARRLSGQLNRLEAQRAIGVTPLRPFEDAFLNAMSGRVDQPQQSRELLDQWLVLYDTKAGQADSQLSPLIPLVRYEHEHLQHREPQTPVDPRAKELIKEIEVIAAGQVEADKRSRLRALIKTYETMDWAGPAIDAAHRQLRGFDSQ